MHLMVSEQMIIKDHSMFQSVRWKPSQLSTQNLILTQRLPQKLFDDTPLNSSNLSQRHMREVRGELQMLIKIAE